MQHSKIARLFLGLNAVFSMLCGLVLLYMPQIAADMLFVQEANWQAFTLRVLGLGLLIFEVGLIFFAKRPCLSKKQILSITIMDLGWVIASVFLLIFNGYLFTELGKTAVFIVTQIVAIFAWGQYVGAKKILPLESLASVYGSGDKLTANVAKTINP